MATPAQMYAGHCLAFPHDRRQQEEGVELWAGIPTDPIGIRTVGYLIEGE